MSYIDLDPDHRRPFTLTAADCDLSIKLGLIDPQDEVEIVESYADVYSPEAQEALARAGRPTQ